MARTTTGETYNVPKGAAYLTSTQVILYGTYFVFYVLLARIVDPSYVGIVTLLTSAQAVFTGLASLSLPSAATRFISAKLAAGDINSAGGVAKTALKISVPAAIVGLLVGIIVSAVISGNDQTFSTILFVTFLASFCADLMQLYSGFFIGVGRYAATLQQNVLYVPLSRGLGLFLAWRLASSGMEMAVLGVVIGWAVGGLASLLLSFYLWHGELPKTGHYPAGPLLAFSLPVLASAMIILAQQWGDIWILRVLLASNYKTGLYSYAVSSITFLSILWLPVSQAIYPALSASHSTGQTQAVSDRLAVAFRLTNLAVLPLGAAVAGVSYTALLLVYGRTYAVNDWLILSILALSSVFTAQGAILFTTLQAVGKTRQYLEIALLSTLIYLGIVVVGVRFFNLDTLAGAIGRAFLAISIVLLARRSLHRLVAVHTMVGMSKAILLAIGVGVPIFILDQIFINWNFSGLLGRAVVQLGIMFVLFVILFVTVSRYLKVFHHGDFGVIRDALPRRLQPYLKVIQRLIIPEDEH